MFQPTARTRHKRDGGYHPAVAYHAHDPAVPAHWVAGQLYRVAPLRAIREITLDYLGQVALLPLDHGKYWEPLPTAMPPLHWSTHAW